MYKLIPNGVDLNGMCIPDDPANSDYAAYLAWLAEGNTPEPYVAPPPAPVTQVTMRQARLALHNAGLLTLVDGAIASQSEPMRTTAQIEWDYASELDRSWPTLIGLAVALGLTESQVDDLFTAASVL